MMDLIEVLNEQEQDILRVAQEIEALRITADLLGEEPASASDRRVEFRQVVNMPSPGLVLGMQRLLAPT